MAVLDVTLGSRDRPAVARATAPSPALQAGALQALCRQVFAFRLVMIGLGTPLALGRTAPGGPTYLVGGAVLVTFMLSYALFRDWERFGPLLLRHRWLLAADMAFSALLLIAARPESPLGLVAVCTPLLAGLVYGWRGSAVYAAVQAVIVALAAEGLTLAVLCVLAGAAGACLRDLLFRFGSASQALTETRARLAVAEAVRGERERLAREMHDSVAKTLHGLALSADALARTTDPAAIRRQAELLSGAARRAAAESRELLTDLRRDLDAPGVSLLGELRRLAPAGTEIRATGTLPVVPGVVARQLLAVTAEALENARRHAGAARVEVEAGADQTRLTLAVRDDGRGLPAAGADLSLLREAGRFGLLGMTERAASIGARIHIGARPDGLTGTEVRLDLPLAALTGEGGA
ncbi:sensor histidine kinase [Streptomyces sp. MJM1172]|uniref:sensor histidine kinase n=1 Tax=Streptomyces sp. MJM1172 TaxID=1703926 RepID=UPI00093C8EA9|nr:histidine kinase [Streptomyces sp. MJM1172]OKI69515.1 histidine kinase [Streptomyces sp. MJM1172]